MTNQPFFINGSNMKYLHSPTTHIVANPLTISV